MVAQMADKMANWWEMKSAAVTDENLELILVDMLEL